jgi:hypothetical protein
LPVPPARDEVHDRSLSNIRTRTKPRGPSPGASDRLRPPAIGGGVVVGTQPFDGVCNPTRRGALRAAR